MKILFVLDEERLGDNIDELALNAAKYSDAIWYRIKNKSDAEIFERARKLRLLLPKSRLILSQRADIAYLAGFDGVHLNNESLPPEIVRKNFPTLILGYSAHSAEECFEMQDTVDYMTLSPIFHTEKSYEVVPLGAIPAPNSKTFALGGVRKDNARALAELGYCGVAGISLYNDMEEIYNIVANV